MKKNNYVFILLIFCVTILILTQTFRFNPETGDKNLDLKLNEINSTALSNIDFFIERTSEVFVVNPNKIKEMLFYMEPADILICFQIQNITEHKLNEINDYFIKTSNKSWSNILQHFGINKTSYEYVELKKIKNFYDNSYTTKNITKVKK